MKENSEFMSRLPFLITTLFLAISIWMSMRAVVNYTLLMIGQFQDSIPVFLLFGNPLKPSLVGMITITFISIIGWLLSSKLKVYQKMKWRVFIFVQMFIGIAFYYLWFITAPVYNTIVPYMQEMVAGVDVVNVWHQVLIGNTDNLMTLLVFIPMIIFALLLIWLSGIYSRHNDTLKEKFKEFEFRTTRLQGFFNLANQEMWPDIILGPDSETKELIVQPGKDRTLNNIIIGSIGTGKTAALVLPILNQDLHWMTRYINRFPREYKREDYHSEDVKGMYLNGISVIEPSNDLCQKAFQLVKAHGIPEKSVFYIDPTNPNTPNINPMQGPVEQVAEAFAMVMEGLAEGGNTNFFFQQSERNHLKHYIHLLKLHDLDKEVTFDMLLDMYNNAQLVRKMHVQLKGTMPKSINDIKDRDERNHWKIVQQIDEWFDMNLVPKTSHGGAPQKITSGEYRGEDAYYDAKAEYVQGLRNILNDIGANKLIRRVLFGSSDFDFDKHLEYGGVLLVNTAKGELQGLSNVLGKLVLLSLQNAVFRREPNISNFHHILVDEFPDYIYKPFKEFPAQSRKYKTILTTVSQSVAQLADKYGETYMQTLLGTFRHKMVYGDITNYDAELFSSIFGEKEHFEEVQNEQSISPLQEEPVTRRGSSYTKTKEAILSASDIIYQKEFQAAVKIVRHNRPIPVRQIDANFVPKEEFKQAIVLVNEEASAIWLDERARLLSDSMDRLSTFKIEDESEEQNYLPEASQAENTSEEKNNTNELEVNSDEISDPEAHTDEPKNDVVSESESRIRIKLRENEKKKDTIVEETKPMPKVDVLSQLKQGNKETAASKEVIATVDEQSEINEREVDSKPVVSKLGVEQKKLLNDLKLVVNEQPSSKSTQEVEENGTDVEEKNQNQEKPTAIPNLGILEGIAKPFQEDKK